MRFSKYHALGNDYLVFNPNEARELSGDEIRLICHPHFGVGSDGILWGPLAANDADFAVRIFNPDGSEAEKSGNGLRIFSRFLWDQRLVGDAPFSISTLGGKSLALVLEHGRLVSVEMGRVSFDSAKIPVLGPAREVLNEQIAVDGQSFTYSAATLGNPHCVVLHDLPTPELAKRFGPRIENDARFPNRTNVQFMKVLDRAAIQIEIWERGAGYTLASGSSSSAAAAVARRLDLCDQDVTVNMPGGTIGIAIGDDYSIRMVGQVTRIAEGEIDEEMFSDIGKLARA